MSKTDNTNNIMSLEDTNTSCIIVPKSENGKIKKKKKNRCQLEGCSKKLTITSFECLCQKRFCPIHRLPENHKCTFDYINHGKEKIKENNPVIINSKIIKI